MATTTNAALDGLSSYSRRFLDAMGDGHGVASPLGAWALLALVSRGADGETRRELETILGCDTDSAFALVEALLDEGHPFIALALGSWNPASAISPEWLAWVRQLPTQVGRGPIPTEKELNQWVRNATGGLIKRFPGKIDERTVSVLASGIAMDGKWKHPFEVSQPGELGPHEFENEVDRVLMRQTDYGLLARTQAAGVVGVLVQESRDGYDAIAVTTASGVSRERTIATAFEILSAEESSYVSLFDLPLCDGPDWSIVEGRYESQFSEEKRRERSTVFIPAWESPRTRTDLLSDSRFGFEAGSRALEAMLPPDVRGYEFKASQVATARYHRYGFHAAAGTALTAHYFCLPDDSRWRPERILTLRFRRPFVVIVVARTARSNKTHESRPWEGVPCMAAWITRMTAVHPHPNEGLML